MNSKSLEIFKSKLFMTFIRPVQQSIYSVCNPQGLRFFTRLRLHNFKDYINPLCSCSLEVENALHFSLYCQHYSTFRMGLMNNVNQIFQNFSYSSKDNIVSLLLYSDSRFDDSKNIFILPASITYILERKIFDFPFSEWRINFYFSLTLILFFISSDTFHLVILFCYFICYTFYVSLFDKKISSRALLNVFLF